MNNFKNKTFNIYTLNAAKKATAVLFSLLSYSKTKNLTQCVKNKCILSFF